MRSVRGRVAIVGVGETPVGTVPGRSALWFNGEAARFDVELVPPDTFGTPGVQKVSLIERTP